MGIVQLIGLVHPKFADCYWEEYKMFHISIKLLDKSESEGPGFISIPDIISKIHITMHKKA